jgi:hypothetical protein
MPRSLSFALIFTLFAAVSAVAQSQDSSSPAPQAPTPDSQTSAETKKPKKVWTNDDLSRTKGTVSVVGDPKNKPKPASSKPGNDQYVASVRKQLDKLQGQIADIDKQLVDLKNFSEGEPRRPLAASSSTKAMTANPSKCRCARCRIKRKILSPKLTRCLTKPARKASSPASCVKCSGARTSSIIMPRKFATTTLEEKNHFSFRRCRLAGEGVVSRVKPRLVSSVPISMEIPFRRLLCQTPQTPVMTILRRNVNKTFPISRPASRHRTAAPSFKELPPPP